VKALLENWRRYVVENREEAEANMRDKIVYHGSDNPDLEHLRAAAPNYEGGIGTGVYVAFDREVAEFYGKNVYKLHLLLSDEDVLWVEHYTLDQYATDSILVGENVPPFGFSVGDAIYHVVGGSGWIDDDFVEESNESIIERELGVASALGSLYRDGEIDEDFYSILANERNQKYIDDHIRGESARFGEAGTFFTEDPEEVANGWIDVWSEVAYMAAKSEGREEGDVDEFLSTFSKVAASSLEAAQAKYAAENSKQDVELISLEEVGEVAEKHGYKAVYVEGIRGGMPDTELLVFDPNHVKMIGRAD